MKIISNGKVYDTGKAKCIGIWFDEDLGNFEPQNQWLYQKRTGEYFLYSFGWDKGDIINPITTAEAKNWVKQHLSDEEYSVVFGGVKISSKEEKTTLSLSVPTETVKKLKNKASETGKSMSSIVTELVEELQEGDFDMNNFEFEGNLLIVDELIRDPAHIDVVKIKDNYYMLPSSIRPFDEPVEVCRIKEYRKKPYKDWERVQDPIILRMKRVIPRGGYKTELPRPITKDEFYLLVKEHSLTDDDISKVFDDSRYGFLGDKYKRHFHAIQIQVNDAIHVEGVLAKMGICAGSTSPNRVSIRVPDDLPIGHEVKITELSKD